jgi:hypothetical protein
MGLESLVISMFFEFYNELKYYEIERIGII